MDRNSILQSLCREYLQKLRPLAKKFGLEGFVDSTIAMNRQSRCAATESEVELLSRAVYDERVSRVEVPKILGKSYRRAEEDGDFDRIKKLKRQGIYSKIGALLLGSELKTLYK